VAKKFRMFAGPNGSGKSTLINEVRKSYNVGFFINADEIESELKKRRFLDLSYYSSKPLAQSAWDEFVGKANQNDIRIDGEFPEVSLRDNFLICKDVLNSYHCSIIAEFLRNNLLDQDQTFSFETVMSHDSKVEFLRNAKEKGFNTYLYFICTQDPKINLQRISNRVEKGGHDVDAQKTVDRYYRSLGLLFDAFMIADRAFIIDSSNKNRDVVLEKKKNQIMVLKESIPEWVNKYLLDKIETED